MCAEGSKEKFSHLSRHNILYQIRLHVRQGEGELVVFLTGNSDDNFCLPLNTASPHSALMLGTTWPTIPHPLQHTEACISFYKGLELIRPLT